MMLSLVTIPKGERGGKQEEAGGKAELPCSTNDSLNGPPANRSGPAELFQVEPRGMGLYVLALTSHRMPASQAGKGTTFSKVAFHR